MAKVPHRSTRNGRRRTARSGAKLDAAFFQQIAENTGVHVIVADAELRIVYMNPASAATLRKLEHLLPCRVDEMIGKSIDLFHKQPEMQRRLLADPRNLPHRANILLGDEILDLTATAIRDADGNYLGPMINWELVTEAETLRQEQQRLRQMVENATLRIIMADRDFKIVYMNPASVNALWSLQHLLPCPVDDMLGKSIDIFHRHPEVAAPAAVGSSQFAPPGDDPTGRRAARSQRQRHSRRARSVRRADGHLGGDHRSGTFEGARASACRNSSLRIRKCLSGR